jgi:hypothetical protein
MICKNIEHAAHHHWRGYDPETHEDVIICDKCKQVWHEYDRPDNRILATRVIFSDIGFRYLHDAVKEIHQAIPDEIMIALADRIEKIRAHYEDECDDDLDDQNRFAYDTKHGDGAHAVLTGKQTFFNTASTGDDLPF